MEYDNNNSGAIFKVENRTNENQPSYRGKINVDGVEKQISLWVKKSKDGSKTFFSAKISEPYNKDAQPVQNQQPVAPPIQEDLDLPF